MFERFRKTKFRLIKEYDASRDSYWYSTEKYEFMSGWLYVSGSISSSLNEAEVKFNRIIDGNINRIEIIQEKEV